MIMLHRCSSRGSSQVTCRSWCPALPASICRMQRSTMLLGFHRPVSKLTDRQPRPLPARGLPAQHHVRCSARLARQGSAGGLALRNRLLRYLWGAATTNASGYGAVMGTSRRWTGADAGIWREGDKALGGWVARAGAEPTMSKAETESIGQAYLADLQRLARSGSELGPVREAMLAAGRRLPDAIESVLRRDAAYGDGAQARVEVEALEAFIGDLDRGGGTLLDSVVRRAARAALAEAAHSAGNRDLFCLLYRQFFAQAVSQLITAVIAEKIKLTVPALRAVDPAGTIADWVAKRVFSLLPNPCDVPADDGGSLKGLAGALLHETVDRALGLSAPAPASGGA